MTKEERTILENGEKDKPEDQQSTTAQADSASQVERSRSPFTASTIGWILILGVVGFWVFNLVGTNRGLRQQEIAESQLKSETLRASVESMVTRHQANVTWPQALGLGEDYRLSPVLEIELEKLWIKSTPILFTGSVLDIEANREGSYAITIERGLLSSQDVCFSTELRVELQSDKALIDEFLVQHPDLLRGDGFDNGVAAVAEIASIESIEYLGEDGTRVNVKIGVGKLLELIYIGDDTL